MRLHHLLVVVLSFTAAGMMRAEDLYVAGFAAKKVYHISSDGRSLKAIPLPGNPFDEVISADGAFLYVSHPSANSVSVIRTAYDTPVAVIGVPSSPRKMAIGNNDTRLYVANNTVSAPHVTIVDISAQPGGGRKNAVLGSIDLSPQGANSAYTVAAFGAFLAVGTQSGHVLLYDTSAIPARFLAKRGIGARVMHVVFSPFGTKLYTLLATPKGATDENGAATPPGNLHVLRAPSLALKSALSVGRSELKHGVVVKGSYVYATDVRGDLHVIDIGTDIVLYTAHLGHQLAGIATTEGKVFVADPARNLIQTIIPAAQSRRDRVGSSVQLENSAVPVGVVALSDGPAGRP